MNSPSGTGFLKSVDTPDISKSGAKLSKLLDSMMQEVSVDYVAHVVANGASAHMSAQRLVIA